MRRGSARVSAFVMPLSYKQARRSAVNDTDTLFRPTVSGDLKWSSWLTYLTKESTGHIVPQVRKSGKSPMVFGRSVLWRKQILFSKYPDGRSGQVSAAGAHPGWICSAAPSEARFILSRTVCPSGSGWSNNSSMVSSETPSKTSKQTRNKQAGFGVSRHRLR